MNTQPNHDFQKALDRLGLSAPHPNKDGYRSILMAEAEYEAVKHALELAMQAVRDDRDWKELSQRLLESEKKIASLKDDAQKRSEWLDKAKADACYHRNISFDEVWKDALAALMKERARPAAPTNVIDEAVKP